MNELLQSIQLYAVSVQRNQELFEYNLDIVINKLNRKDIEPHYETIHEIHEHMKVIDSLLNFYHVPRSDKFIKAIDIFVNQSTEIICSFIEQSGIGYRFNNPDPDPFKRLKVLSDIYNELLNTQRSKKRRVE